MAMNSRDYELIALGHVLTRYRLTGQLPNIDGRPFNLEDFKAKLFAGLDDTDVDVNINVDNVNTEANVTVVENNTINCDDESHNHSETQSDEVDQPSDETDQSENLSEPSQTEESDNSITGGRLFQYLRGRL